MTFAGVPSSFVNGTTADGPQVNADFAAVTTGLNNIDAGQITTGTISSSRISFPNYSVVLTKFLANGTWTPTAGMQFAIIECVGGGAGAGGAQADATHCTGGGGGGAGSYARARVTAAQAAPNQAVTIGAGGAGGTAGNGSNGTDTSVGALCIGKGGSLGIMGTTAAVGTGGAGGVAGTGDVTIPGNGGTNGFYASIVTVLGQAGSGGSGVLGGAAVPATGGTLAVAGGAGAANSGAGGGGGWSHGVGAAGNGGNGGSGIVIITEFVKA